jgi:hypothetical protein
MKKLALLFVGLILFVPYAFSDPIVEVEVQDNELSASIEVAGTFSIDLTITFENVIGLNSESLVFNVDQINPLELNLLSRIGPQNLFSIPAQLPILINITPSSTSTLSFTGVYEIELSTSNLSFDPKYRLYTASNGGNFDDITTFSGIGSYRVRGTGGDFSDFLIINDLRTKSTVVNDKYTELQNALTNHTSAIAPEMFTNLQAKLTASKSSYQSGLIEDAITSLDDFINLIKADEGESVPNTFRANDSSVINVSGELRRKAATLIFSLRL